MTRLADLAGIGKGTLERFAELGIHTPQDLLDDLPYRYEDLRFPTPARELGKSESEENAVGTIIWVKERRARHLAIVEAELADDTGGTFMAKWFGRAYLLGSLKKGMRLFVRGRVSRTLAGPAMNVTTHRRLEDDETYRGHIVPVYSASKSLTSRKIQQVIERNLPRLIEEAGQDALPAAIRKQHGYPELERAYRALHAPATPEEAQKARERFIFTEFLALALTAELKRNARERERDAYVLSAAPALLAQFERELPFPPTGAQRRVIAEIWNDMGQESPMNRLLQGDVGSGKTLVAAAAILLAARNGVQSALMAPTEILAAQHAAKLAPLLMPFGITVEAVFGSQAARARATAVAKARRRRRLARRRHARTAYRKHRICAPGPSDYRRAASLRRGAACGAARERPRAAYLAHDGNPHPAHACAIDLCGPGRIRHRRTSAGPHAHRDICAASNPLALGIRVRAKERRAGAAGLYRSSGYRRIRTGHHQRTCRGRTLAKRRLSGFETRAAAWPHARARQGSRHAALRSR